MFEALGRAGQAVDQVGHQNNVKWAKAFPQEGRVALLETDTGAIQIAWHFGDGRLAKLALNGKPVRQLAILLQLVGGVDETFGQVDTDDLSAVSGEFEG